MEPSIATVREANYLRRQTMDIGLGTFFGGSGLLWSINHLNFNLQCNSKLKYSWDTCVLNFICVCLEKTGPATTLCKAAVGPLRIGKYHKSTERLLLSTYEIENAPHNSIILEGQNNSNFLLFTTDFFTKIHGQIKKQIRRKF